MTPDPFDGDTPNYAVTIDGGRSWHVGSDFGEYDAAHAVAGALLAGAERVVVERTDVDDDPGTITDPLQRGT